jgi:hypothetical protein
VHTTLACHPAVTPGAVAAGPAGGRLAVVLPAALALVLPLMMIFMRRGMRGLGPMRGTGGMRGMGPMRGMGGMDRMDMRTYASLFARHAELRRTVELIPGGIRTLTEADSADLAGQLQAHVTSMYQHLDQGSEITCMSASLPTLLRNAQSYRRTLTTTPRGVAVTETSDDPQVTAAIRAHAEEVTGFVELGVPAMMKGMMGP